MDLVIRQISYAHETEQHYYPMWHVDCEIDGKRQLRKVQAQEVYGAKQALCRELGLPFSWP
jgi:hypothetical protein